MNDSNTWGIAVIAVVGGVAVICLIVGLLTSRAEWRGRDGM